MGCLGKGNKDKKRGRVVTCVNASLRVHMYSQQTRLMPTMFRPPPAGGRWTGGGRWTPVGIGVVGEYWLGACDVMTELRGLKRLGREKRVIKGERVRVGSLYNGEQMCRAEKQSEVWENHNQKTNWVIESRESQWSSSPALIFLIFFSSPSPPLCNIPLLWIPFC